MPAADPEQRDLYLDALLDGVDAKDAFVHAQIARGLEELGSDIRAVVHAAGLPGAERSDIDEVFEERRVRRTVLLLMAGAAREADRKAEDIITAQAEAVAANAKGGRKRTPRIGPITKAHLDARRKDRSDAT